MKNKKERVSTLTSRFSITLRLLLACFLFGSSTVMYAQRTITGVVKDSRGDLIMGAAVIVKGTTNGTPTDMDGKFSIENVPTNATLVVTYIGYKAKEVKVGNQSVVNIIIDEDAQNLEEVVVVGYGTVKKSDLTGAVSSIKAEELSKLPMSSIDQGIQGRAAGVQVTNASGAPGGQVTIRVRGGNSLSSSNEPLYVVDGFPISAGASADGQGRSSMASNPLASINPNDIESIEILKDASAAAVYGSRGANGVVLITTKRGKTGKATVTYEGYVGIQDVAKKLDFMNGTEFAIFANEAAANDNKGVIFGGTDPRFPAPQSIGQGTDWQSLIFRSAMTHNHQVGVTGGTETVTYAVTGNFFQQDGVLIGSDFNRGSIRSNLDFKLNDWIKAGISFTASRVKANIGSSESDGGGSSGAINAALIMAPTEPVYESDGTYHLSPWLLGHSSVGNPYATVMNTKDESTQDRALANAFVKFDFGQWIDGLALEVRGGTDFSNAFRDTYAPSNTFLGASKKGMASKAYRRTTSYLNENLLTYSRKFGKHSLNLLGGLTLQTFSDMAGKTVVAGFVNDILEDNNMGSASGIDGMPSSWRNSSTQASWLGRINYGYDDRYLLTLTGRADGSSKFGANNKWGFFPSVAGAWRLTQESFMENAEWLDNAKVRVSYGTTGNQNLASYKSLPSLTQYSYNFSDQKATGFAPSKIANPDLKWETTSTLDIGLDLGFLDNRLNFTVDYYKKHTKDLLWDISIPNSSGFGSIFKNHGQLENWGVEATASYDLVTKRDFSWNTTLMWSMNRNKVTDLEGVTPSWQGEVSGHLKAKGSWLEEGLPVGVWNFYVYDGVFQNEEQLKGTKYNATDRLGSPKFWDADENGKIDMADNRIVGDPNPDFIFSWNNTFKYKNFDLNIFINGSYGNEIYNVSRGEYATSTTWGSQRREILDRWTPENPNSNIPAARTTVHPGLLISSWMIEDGSYIRLKNIVFGYNIPMKKGLKAIRVYASAQNLFTFTNYSGFDPEVSSKGTANLQPGVDYNAYPSTRTFMIGTNITF